MFSFPLLLHYFQLFQSLFIFEFDHLFLLSQNHLLLFSFLLVIPLTHLQWYTLHPFPSLFLLLTYIWQELLDLLLFLMTSSREYKLIFIDFLVMAEDIVQFWCNLLLLLADAVNCWHLPVTTFSYCRWLLYWLNSLNHPVLLHIIFRFGHILLLILHK